VVTGCYDRDGELTGTVTGNILRAIGIERGTKVQSAFILAVREDGTLLGVRSSNRAPFAVYTGEAAPATSAPRCPPRPATPLGCGAVIHGITFDFDSATIRPDSEPVLAKLRRDRNRGAHLQRRHGSIQPVVVGTAGASGPCRSSAARGRRVAPDCRRDR
jgi:hypothetical protein